MSTKNQGQKAVLWIRIRISFSQCGSTDPDPHQHDADPQPCQKGSKAKRKDKSKPKKKNFKSKEENSDTRFDKKKTEKKIIILKNLLITSENHVFSDLCLVDAVYDCLVAEVGVQSHHGERLLEARLKKDHKGVSMWTFLLHMSPQPKKGFKKSTRTVTITTGISEVCSLQI